MEPKCTTPSCIWTSAIRGILVFKPIDVVGSLPRNIPPVSINGWRQLTGLVVALAVVVVILDEEVLICAVSGEGNAGNTEAGEDALETVEAAEGAGVSPGLAADG
jgi:hypothetical protein